MLAILFNTLYVVLLLWYRHQWRLNLHVPEILYPGEELPRVSVIVPVRNESGNLPDFLSRLASQEYPAGRIEWIFVDDHSEDDTVQLLSAYSAVPVKLIRLEPADGEGKKAALEKGIRAAAGEWILTTDADCILPFNWVHTLMNAARNSAADMICGTVKVTSGGGFLHDFQAMETAVLQLSGAASLQAGHPLLNTGASLAFRKASWEQVEGYSKHRHLASGDDTFLMLAFHQQQKGSVKPCTQPAAMAETRPHQDWTSVVRQRLRWNGKVKHYPLGYIHAVGLLVLSAAISFLVLLFLSFFGDGSLFDLILVFVLRFYAEYAILQEWEDRSRQKFSLFSIFCMSWLYPLFTVFSMVFRPFIRPGWKGRPVNKSAA
ncbi:MAG: glycosyltransferase [Bacteroidia bacterium]|nr:glycosyltransferase [Bacteroidia bacterium]